VNFVHDHFNRCMAGLVMVLVHASEVRLRFPPLELNQSDIVRRSDTTILQPGDHVVV
jgi:hypothetical protein